MLTYVCRKLAIVFAGIIFAVNDSYGANIMIFCIPVYSQIVGPVNVGKVLQNQGHNITIVVPIQLKSKIDEAGFNVVVYHSLDGFNMFQKVNNIVLNGLEHETSPASLLHEFANLTKILLDKILNDQNLLQDIKSQKPDVMILTSIPSARMLTIIPYKLNVPFIFISTMATPQFSRSPILPTVVPNDFLDMTDQMTFQERIINTFVELVSYFNDPFSYPNAVQRYAPEKPFISVHDLQAKALLWIVNRHVVLSNSPPALPNVKHVGHLIKLKPQVLAKEFQVFMDNAVDGVVIVSFGSILKSVPSKTLEKFMTSFRQTKYKFIIRHPGNDLKNSDKFLFTDWLPQYDLLRHNNTRLLITHCGTNSIQEAVFVGVPMIGFPVMNDQPHNAAMIVRKGFGLRLEIRSFTVRDLVSTITEVITNPAFRNRVQKASMIMRAERVEPVEEAAYWINHVLTFGADHLRSSAQDIPLWKYLGMDLLAVFLVTWHILLVILIKILYSCFHFCCREKQKKKTE